MSTLTEKGHAGGFILSVANGNRSFKTVTVASGESLAAGQVFALVGGFAVAFDESDSTGGADTVAGVLFDAADATDAAVDANAVVRDAEVNGNELVWPTAIIAGDKTDAIDALAVLGIIVR